VSGNKVGVMAKHIHKYRRMRVGKQRDYPIYRCFKPGCPHYISEDHIINRESICWRCDKPFFITLKLKGLKPICQDCKDGKKSEAKAVEGFSLEDMLANITAEREEE
jgi:hypothetical protein